MEDSARRRRWSDAGGRWTAASGRSWVACCLPTRSSPIRMEPWCSRRPARHASGRTPGWRTAAARVPSRWPGSPSWRARSCRRRRSSRRRRLPSAVSSCRSDGTHRPGPRLPAGAPRRRARLRGHHRHLAGCPDRHPSLRRTRHSGPLLRPGGHDLAGGPSGSPPEQLSLAAAALPDRGGPPAPRRLRLRCLQQQRLRPRRAAARVSRARLLLPLAVPLRLARAGAGARARSRGRCVRCCGSLLRRHRGFDRRAARTGGPVRGQLGDRAGADQALLGSRCADRAPAGRRRALHDRRARGLRAVRGRTGEPQAARAGDRGGDRGRTPAQARGRAARS